MSLGAYDKMNTWACHIINRTDRTLPMLLTMPHEPNPKSLSILR